MTYRIRAAVVGGALLMTPLAVAAQTSSATAASTPAVGVYSGPAVPNGVTGHTSFSGWLGNPVPYAVEFLNSYGSWDEVANPYWALDNWSAWAQAQAGRRLVLSVPLLVSSASGQLSQGAAGAFDSNFRTLAQNMVNRNLGTSVIRLGWEMNNSSFPWWAGNDPASFRSFYARTVGVMRSVPGAAFTFDWNPNLGVQGGSPLTTFDAFYPGDAYVDVIGLDVYDIKWGDSTSDPASRWAWMVSQQLGLQQHRTFAATHGKPVSFPEWGLYKKGDQMGGGGDSPYFIDSMVNWIASGATTYHAYFDADWGGGSLATFPNAQAQYKARLGASITTTTLSSTTTTVVAPPTTTTTVVAPPTTTTTVPPTTTTTVAPAPLLTVSNVRASSVTATSAVVTWTSSSPASTEVGYGVSTVTSTVFGANGVTSHSIVLTGLAARTKYTFEVRSQTATGTRVVAPVGFFTTAKR
jgi:hypothetical protein